MDINNNRNYNIAAPTSGVYQGLAIFFDRENTSDLSFSNNGLNSLTGTIYAKSGRLDASNNASITQAHSIVIVGTALMSNNADVTLTFDPSENYAAAGRFGGGSLAE